MGIARRCSGAQASSGALCLVWDLCIGVRGPVLDQNRLSSAHVRGTASAESLGLDVEGQCGGDSRHVRDIGFWEQLVI